MASVSRFPNRGPEGTGRASPCGNSTAFVSSDQTSAYTGHCVREGRLCGEPEGPRVRAWPLSRSEGVKSQLPRLHPHMLQCTEKLLRPHPAPCSPPLRCWPVVACGALPVLPCHSGPGHSLPHADGRSGAAHAAGSRSRRHRGGSCSRPSGPKSCGPGEALSPST